MGKATITVWAGVFDVFRTDVFDETEMCMLHKFRAWSAMERNDGILRLLCLRPPPRQ